MLKRLHLLWFPDSFTLKNRIVVVFALCTLLPLICTVVFAYHTMSTMLTSKLNTSLRDNLRQVELSIENILVNLNHVSQQLAAPGSVGMKLDAFLKAKDPYERASLYSEFKNEFNVLTFSNPSIGMTMYFLENEGRYLLNNYGVKPDSSMEDLPILADRYKIRNHGPHISLQRHNHQYVLSTLRQVDIRNRDTIYVYIESAFNLTEDILQRNERTQRSSYLLMNAEGEVTYSDLPERFPVQSMFSEQGNEGMTGAYYWFKEQSDQGWSIVSLIPQVQYDEEKNEWIVQMAYLTIFFVVLSLIASWLLWLMVYRPMNTVHEEIDSLTNNDFASKVIFTKIPEFDALLAQFQHMKAQIRSLFQQVEQKEKRRADLEVEKLMYQINPHFLMNTLDTARWMAVMNGQKDIDHILTSLNRLLSYNLGKLGELSNVAEEIESMKQYLSLQQHRYDFTFDVQIEASDDLMQTTVSRFILQPLVENCLYHGLEDDGHISVCVFSEHDQLVIVVSDDGKGMSQEKIDQLLTDDTALQKNGMGIGMSYVKRVLERQYEGASSLRIKSTLGKGTSIYVTIPTEVHGNDQHHDR
ncbi:sensor histidine kinase [Aureibacillus halotolerans]|uniref:histidine kinase n=1 Tax=Aureibacillus halotolerans TaxID=1508390 RepID=A0A4R6U863_9BACI|nr:histidine kinase [Aureibacillus halotolerans]TDQ41133.1 two-component system sensor histidine kinase YesM [Aureibacillus halotolerans]